MAKKDEDTSDTSDDNVSRQSKRERLERVAPNAELWEAMKMGPGELPEVFSDAENSSGHAVANDDGHSNNDNDANVNTPNEVEVAAENNEESDGNPSTSTNQSTTLRTIAWLVDQSNRTSMNRDANNNESPIVARAPVPTIVVTGPSPTGDAISNASEQQEPEEQEDDFLQHSETSQLVPRIHIVPLSQRDRLHLPSWLPLPPKHQRPRKNFTFGHIPNLLYKFGLRHPGTCKNYLNQYSMDDSLFNGDGEKIRDFPKVSRPTRKTLLDRPIIQLVAPRTGPFDMFFNPYPEWLRISWVNYEYLPIGHLSTIHVLILMIFRCLELFFSNGRRQEIDILDVLLHYGYEEFVQFMQLNTLEGNLLIQLRDLSLYSEVDEEEPEIRDYHDDDLD